MYIIYIYKFLLKVFFFIINYVIEGVGGGGDIFSFFVMLKY